MDKTKEEDRAVYRYVFACPGEAGVLAQAAMGVCYFNMRAVRSNGDSVVQRSYNATAVRVIRLDASGGAFSPEPPRAPAASPGDAARAEDDHASTTALPGGDPADAPVVLDDSVEVGSGIIDSGTEVMTKDGKVRVVPAVESREGNLCVEMRIRFYKDGVMSKLLDQLPKDSANATVQLQGPFLVDSLSPPPAHRNVIMIAAGTGINPMIQLIRDYQSFDSQDTLRTTGRSRMALLHQVTSASDLYCDEELCVLEARGRGLLEITNLVSGNHRKTNNPKAPNAFQRRRKKRADAAAAKKAAAALERDAADRSDPGKSTLGILSRLFSGSPAASRDNSTDGGAVAVSVRAPPPLSVCPPDPETVEPASDSGTVPVACDARVGAENDGDGGNGDGGTDSGAVSDAVVDLLSTDVNRFSNGSDGVSTSGHYSGAFLTSAAAESQSRGETTIGDTREVESHQSESSCTQRDLTAAFLKKLKTGAGRDGSASTSSVGSSLNFGPVPRMGIKPKALLQPSRDLLQGARGVPSRKAPVLPPPSSCSSSMVFEQRKEKVSKEILREIFGEGLMHAIEVFNARHPQTLGISQEGVERSGLEADLAALCGTETEPGKLQVVLSGPSGFVFMVEHMLEEMGVPKGALVILD